MEDFPYPIEIRSMTDAQLEAAAVAAETWPDEIDCATNWWWARFNKKTNTIIVCG